MKRWARRNRVTLVPTVTNASWMNAIECQTRDIQKLALEGTDYRNLGILESHSRKLRAIVDIGREARDRRFRDT
ncbi:MAG: hypothetical protein ACRECH_17050 [Nitrososphaerales archaeon]